MSKSVPYSLQPKVPFAADFPLSLMDGISPRTNSRYLFIYETDDVDDIKTIDAYRQSLVYQLIAGLESLLALPSNGAFALPELLGTIYENPVDGRLSLKVTKSSTVSFLVSYRDDIDFCTFQPSQRFPRQCFDAEVFATGFKGLAIKMPAKAFGAQ